MRIIEVNVGSEFMQFIHTTYACELCKLRLYNTMYRPYLQVDGDQDLTKCLHTIYCLQYALH